MSNGPTDERWRERLDELEGEIRELRLSRRRLVQAADADRRAIERSLHDGVQQYLAALAMDVRRLSGRLDRDPATATAILVELTADLQQAIDEAVALAQRIHPPPLEGGWLASALRSASEAAGVTLVVDIPRREGYPREIIDAVYWSCVEVLSSASRGTEARVSVRDADDIVTFEVAIAGSLSDDRLDRLRDRVEALDGRIDVENEEGLGPRVQGWLPLSP